jgi:sucrose-6-phosphate hydrolase SacC (GH32 family)
MLPVEEIENLYQRAEIFDGLVLEPDQANPLGNLKGGLYDIEIEADLSLASQLILDVRGQRLIVDVTQEGLSLGESMNIPGTKNLSLRIVVDNTSLDVYFGEHGLYYSPQMIVPGPNKSLGIEVKGGKAVFGICRVRELKSIWKKDGEKQ